MVHARSFIALAVLGLLAACRNEPDFDERYEAAEEKIRTAAAEMDKELVEADRKVAAGKAEETQSLRD